MVQSLRSKVFGDSDVGDNIMLVTIWSKIILARYHQQKPVLKPVDNIDVALVLKLDIFERRQLVQRYRTPNLILKDRSFWYKNVHF